MFDHMFVRSQLLNSILFTKYQKFHLEILQNNYDTNINFFTKYTGTDICFITRLEHYHSSFNISIFTIQQQMLEAQIHLCPIEMDFKMPLS